VEGLLSNFIARFSVFFSRESAQTVMKANAEKDNQRQLLVTGDGDQTEDQLYAWYRQITSTSKTDSINKDSTFATENGIQLGAHQLGVAD
jgi:hypothetical protein